MFPSLRLRLFALRPDFGLYFDLLGILDVGKSLEEATLTQDSLPELDADDAEYEKYEEAQEEDVA